MLKKIPVKNELKESTQEKINRSGGVKISHRLKSDCVKRLTFLLHPDAIEAVRRLKFRFPNQPTFLTVSYMLIFAAQEMERRGLSVESNLEIELGI